MLVVDCTSFWQYFLSEAKQRGSSCKSVWRSFNVSPNFVWKIWEVHQGAHLKGENRSGRKVGNVEIFDERDPIWRRERQASRLERRRFDAWEQPDVLVWFFGSQAQAGRWLHGSRILESSRAMGDVRWLYIPHSRIVEDKNIRWSGGKICVSRHASSQDVLNTCDGFVWFGLRWSFQACFLNERTSFQSSHYDGIKWGTWKEAFPQLCWAVHRPSFQKYQTCFVELCSCCTRFHKFSRKSVRRKYCKSYDRKSW